MNFNNANINDIQLDFSIDINLSNGTSIASIDIPLPEGRNGFEPNIELSYSSSARNSIFGMGWSLNGVSFISLDLKNGLPKYIGEENYALNGSNSLVPYIKRDNRGWEKRIEENQNYWIHHFRVNFESEFTRFEKWVHKSTREIHWRTRSKNNITSIYGKEKGGKTKVFNPENDDKIFIWLLESQFDNLGNAIKYTYKDENSDNVNTIQAYETQRLKKFLKNGFAQKYLNKIFFSNSKPINPEDVIPADNTWLNEITFDYGEYPEKPYNTSQPETGANWPARKDPYSIYGAGFEVRTYRLCRRLLIHRNYKELGPLSSLTGIFECKYDELETGTTLQSVSYTGVRKDLVSGAYSEKQLPEISIDYTKPKFGQMFQGVSKETHENFPQGFNESKTQFVDLFGEGLPGILKETNNNWHYKSNKGNGVFEKQAIVIEKPSQMLGLYALGDFDNDGNINLFSLQGRNAGYFEYDRNLEKWSGFNPFKTVPQTDNGQFIDVNADGYPDLVVEKNDSITYYPFKGKEGFEKPFEFSKPLSNGVEYAPVIGERRYLNYFFEDMTGDGLPDQVRIKNGRVEYFPNLGNGHFGSVVLMENAPVFDFETHFDPRRIRMYDIDGSGTTDIVYIGRGEIKYWYNGSGNMFLEGGCITGLPYINDVSSCTILDFLCNGTPCLIWSNSFTHNQHSTIKYLELTSGVKPRLLSKIKNGIGREEQIEYGFSAKHYLRDKRNNESWISKIPSHFTVADKKVVIDHITNSKLVTEYKYHNGHYDGNERTFVTFGLVEQFDTQLFDNREAPSDKDFVQPTCTKTWFHNGLYGWDNKIAHQFYQKDPEQPFLISQTFETQQALDTVNFRNAHKSLSGSVIRQEVFEAQFDGRVNEHPYTVVQNALSIRVLQPKFKKRDACFFSFLCETLNITYEQNPEDPKIAHHISVEVGKFGDLEAALNITYARKGTSGYSDPAQYKDIITASTHQYIYLDTLENYRTSILYESKDFEINHLQRNGYDIVKRTEIQRGFAPIIESALAFDEVFPSGINTLARLNAFNRTYFWNDDLSNVSLLGQTGKLVFAHHEEAACFRTELINNVFIGKIIHTNLSDTEEGNYKDEDGYWWQRLAIQHYNGKEEFYTLSQLERDAESNIQFIYDVYYLNLIGTIDALGNKVLSEIDYNLSAPFRITDENDNVSEVLYDALGIPILTFGQGTVLDEQGNIKLYGSGVVRDYVEKDHESFDDILDKPLEYLQQANTFLFYDLNCWNTYGIPLRSIQLTRENLVHQGGGIVHNDTRIIVTVDYQDCFGRSIQSKTKIEAGEAIARHIDGTITLDPEGEPETAHANERWHVSGHVAYNNKQLPVRQFEPFFSSIVEFENEEILQVFGVSLQNYYDAVGRVYKTDYPNGTFSEVRLFPWEIHSFDENDTVDRSIYKTFREFMPAEEPEKQALENSLVHKETPLITVFDGLERAVAIIETSNDSGIRKKQSRYDIKGNIIGITDTRNLEAFIYKYDMRGRLLYEKSIDAGEKWHFYNAVDLAIHFWDSRNIHQRTYYDVLDRTTSIQINDAVGFDQITERFTYGEDPIVLKAKERNLRGKLVHHYDQAGILEVEQITPEGTPLSTVRRLTEQYTSEPDWTDIATVGLNKDAYRSQYEYDALGRALQQQLPDNTTRKFIYNQTGVINKLKLTTADGILSEKEILKAVEYDANGMRKSTLLGNDVELKYTYDEETHRMKRLQARSMNGNQRIYQDISYTYDPVGNLVYMNDEAQQPSNSNLNVVEGLQVSSHSAFTYDAFGQLKTATGRVHQALLQQDYKNSNTQASRTKGTRHITLNNGAAIERYTRNYEYDKAGNITHLAHKGKSRNWTKQMWISETSNRSLSKFDFNGIEIQNPESWFDRNGNCSKMHHLTNIQWNYRDNIRKVVVIDRSAEGKANDEEYYVYGGDGMRIRKITQRLTDATNNIIELSEKIYLDGCEIKRIIRNGNETLKRYTSHISDGTNLLARIHSWEKDENQRETDNISQKKIHYQLANHIGSASIELNEEGEVITYEEYFPFGGTAFIAGRNKRDVDLKTYRYSGKERDDFSGLYYFGYRYYAHFIGGWLSPDPIGPEDAENLYLYVHNNPVNLVDPNGLESTGGYRDLPESVQTPKEAINYWNANIRKDGGRKAEYAVAKMVKRRGEEYKVWKVYGDLKSYINAASKALPKKLEKIVKEASSDDVLHESEGGTTEDDLIIDENGESVPGSGSGDAESGEGSSSGANGEAADSDGTGKPSDTSIGGNNDGTGKGGAATQTNGGGGGGNKGDGGTGGSSDKGTGKGGQGKSSGKGTSEHGESPGGKKSGKTGGVKSDVYGDNGGKPTQEGGTDKGINEGTVGGDVNATTPGQEGGSTDGIAGGSTGGGANGIAKGGVGGDGEGETPVDYDENGSPYADEDNDGGGFSLEGESFLSGFFRGLFTALLFAALLWLAPIALPTYLGVGFAVVGTGSIAINTYQSLNLRSFTGDPISNEQANYNLGFGLGGLFGGFGGGSKWFGKGVTGTLNRGINVANRSASILDDFMQPGLVPAGGGYSSAVAIPKIQLASATSQGVGATSLGVSSVFMMSEAEGSASTDKYIGKESTSSTSSLEPTHYITRSKNAMKSLLNDIRANGIKESIKFVESKGVKYIVDGHHRYYIAKYLKISNVPVQRVQLPYKGYKNTKDLIMESGSHPGHWKYLIKK